MSKARVTGGTTNGNAIHSQWRINSSGQAERSSSDGAWQTVLQNEKSKMRIVTVFGSDVWIGGEGLHLYHSSDNGATWDSVALPAKTSGEHAITHIIFQTPQGGTVEADDGTSWHTSDGGRTWD